MRYFLLFLVVSLTVTLLAACAGLDGSGEPGVVDPPPQTKMISFGCASPVTGATSGGGVAWELTVDPRPIVSGQKFAVDLQAKAIFDEFAIGLAQIFVVGGFRDVNVVDLQATVHVRKGATGEDVVLRPEPIPYVCVVSGTSCDPENDLPGDPHKRGNTDCEPEADTNPCGRFVEIPTSDDCAPGGFCESLGQTGRGSQCDVNEFCVSGPFEMPLKGRPEAWEADASGNVLFGFADEGTEAEILEDGSCNEGTWAMPIPMFDDPVGPNGVRLILGNIPSAVECVMGEDSRGDFGIDSCDPLSSRTPDSRLIRFPIQAP